MVRMLGCPIIRKNMVALDNGIYKNVFLTSLQKTRAVGSHWNCLNKVISPWRGDSNEYPVPITCFINS